METTTPQAPIELEAISDIMEEVDDLPLDKVPPNSAMLLRPVRPERPSTVARRVKSEKLSTRKNRYKAAAMRACSAQDMKEIFEKAVEQAKMGDRDARRFIAEHLIGKPGAADGDGPSMNVGSLQVALFGSNQPRSYAR